MWKFKPFSHRESANLEGRSIDIGNLKVHVRNLIAEGGLSCVYLARDAVHPHNQYALKHIIFNDGELLELVMNEISVMKLLKGHPNITKLISCTIMDTGRTKEALLVMEFCERNLATYLDNGAHFFEEKDILLIFRDICNAVLAMHCQSPPIAHRDLKAENVLLGADGAWKLCDFGSTSCNHKCFTRPEEMGIEEDNIRRYTTPSYRAPEMWDLYRRDVINEKVDIWALGCLLYRMCYLKSAFDGESKLQIINVNYHIPESPKYTSSLVGLIKDMIQGSPGARPNIMQILSRTYELLSLRLQKHLPASSSANDMSPLSAKLRQEGGVNTLPRTSIPPAPISQRTTAPFSKEMLQINPALSNGKAGIGVTQIGSFCSTQRAQGYQGSQGSLVIQDKAVPNSQHHDIIVPKVGMEHTPQSINNQLISESKPVLHNKYFDASLSGGNTNRILGANKSATEEQNSEVSNLKSQLNQANIEKAEIAIKHEKLTVICQLLRQEIHELKLAHSTCAAPPASKGSSKSQICPASLQFPTLQKERFDPNLLELEQAILASSHPPTAPSPPNHELVPWQAFDEEAKPSPPFPNSRPGLPQPSDRQTNWTNF